MPTSKHDPLYILYGTTLGTLSTLLLYAGTTHPEADLDIDDAIVSGLGGTLLGLLPEILRLLEDRNSHFKQISELLKALNTAGLKIGTLMSLMSVVSPHWAELNVGTRAALSIPLTFLDAFLTHAHEKKAVDDNKARYFLNTLVAAFSTFMTFLVTSKMYEEIVGFDIELSHKIKQATVTIAASLAGISNLLATKQHVEGFISDRTNLAMKIYHRISAFLTYITGHSVWLGFMAALIQMKLIEQFYPKASLKFEDAMGLFIVDSLILMPYFEALMREYDSGDSNKKIQALDFVAEVLKGAIISLSWVSPGDTIPTPLLFSTTGAGALSYFLPQLGPPDKLKKLHGAVSGLLAEALDSGVAVSFIRTLFADLIPKTLSPGIYAALLSSILFDMFILKPAAIRDTHKAYKIPRVLRNALLTLGFANSAERVLDKVIEAFFGYNLPTTASVIAVGALVLVEVTGDLLAEEKTSPKLLAAMRSIIVLFGLLQGWYDAFLAMDEEDAPESFAVAFGMTLVLTVMTFWFSETDITDSLKEAREWIATPFNAVANAIEAKACGGYSTIS